MVGSSITILQTTHVPVRRHAEMHVNSLAFERRIHKGIGTSHPALTAKG